MYPLVFRHFIEIVSVIIDDLNKTTGLIVLTIFIGLILSGSDRFVYYVFEGFRATKLTNWIRQRLEGRVRNRAQRLNHLHSLVEKSQADELEATHLAEYLQSFPLQINQAGATYSVVSPTRLGNIVASYELYAESRYGIDGTFYWYHMYFKAPTVAQSQLETNFTVASGWVLAAFAALISIIVYASILALRGLGEVVSITGILRMELLPRPSLSDTSLLVILGTAVGLYCLFYYLAIGAHSDYGKQVRAVIDMTIAELISLGEGELPSKGQRDALERRREFLDYGAQSPGQPARRRSNKRETRR